MIKVFNSKTFQKLLFIGIIIGIFLNLILIYLKISTKKNRQTTILGSAIEYSPNDNQVTYTRWIVIVSSSGNIPVLSEVASLPGWMVVEVALDSNAKPRMEKKNYVFLDGEKQAKLGYNIEKYLIDGNIGRKNVGFLYAISNGATVVYETCGNIKLGVGLQRFQLDRKVMRGLMFSGEHIFNPYHHFGQPTLWPRGFPLNDVGDEITNEYVLGEWNTPQIQQGLVMYDPDVDSIVKLSRKQKKAHFNVSFDTRSPPAILPEGVFSPLSSKNTVFLYKALWALLLPVSVPHSESDIWRGYWAQRLLWEIDGNIGYFASSAVQMHVEHEFNDVALEEQRMYFQGNKLLDNLREWQCASELSFFDCVENLSNDMVNWEFWDYDDYELTKAWITDLKKIGYLEPSRISKHNKPYNLGIRSLFTKISKSDASLYRDPSSSKAVYYWPSVQNPPQTNSEDEDVPSISWKHINKVTKMCKGAEVSVSHKIFHAHRKFHDILLIIVFNFPHLQNIDNLYTLYSMHFSHIMFCANDTLKFIEVSKTMSQRVTFVKTYMNQGVVAYNCLSHAMAMGYDVDGYIMMGDDVLLNTWNIVNLPLNSFWFQKSFAVFNTSQTYFDNRWLWWSRLPGKQAYKSLTKTLSTLSPRMSIVRDFMTMIELNTKSTTGLLRAVSDFVYVPQRFKEKALFFFELFSRHEVFLELAIPSILGGLDLLQNIVPVKGVVLWHTDRANYTAYFHPESHYMHPLKLGKEMLKRRGWSFVCSRVIPLMLRGEPLTH